MAYQLVNLATFWAQVGFKPTYAINCTWGTGKTVQKKITQIITYSSLGPCIFWHFLQPLCTKPSRSLLFFWPGCGRLILSLSRRKESWPYCSLNLSLNLRYLDRTMIEALHTTMELIAGARVEIVVFLLAACTHYVLFTLRVPLRQDWCVGFSGYGKVVD